MLLAFLTLTWPVVGDSQATIRDVGISEAWKIISVLRLSVLSSLYKHNCITDSG